MRVITLAGSPRYPFPFQRLAGIRQRDAHRRRYRSLPLGICRTLPRKTSCTLRFDNPALQTLNEQLAGADGPDHRHAGV